MDNKPTKKRSRWPVVVMALVLVLPTLYVASIGPAAVLVGRKVITIDTYMAAYTPVIWVTNRVPPADHALEAYEFWWIERCLSRPRPATH